MFVVWLKTDRTLTRRLVEGKIQETERAHEFYKANVVWSTVNEISGRKGSSHDRIRGSCPKKRIKLWEEHFEGLLGLAVVD